MRAYVIKLKEINQMVSCYFSLVLLYIYLKCLFFLNNKLNGNLFCRKSFILFVLFTFIKIFIFIIILGISFLFLKKKNNSWEFVLKEMHFVIINC